MEINSYYECHITFLPKPAPDGGSGKVNQNHVTSRGWKFSAIDGDIVEGDGVKYYATRHFNVKLPVSEVQRVLFDMADILNLLGYNVTRRKIEHVIFDDRSFKICPPSCEQCIVD